MKYTLLFLLMFSVAVDGQETTKTNYADAFPVFEEPYHKPVYEQGSFKVLDVRIPSLATSQFHVHAEPIHYVLFQDAYVVQQLAGRDWSSLGEEEMRADLNQDVGRSSADVYSAENKKIHRVRNIGKQDYRLLVIINQGTGATHSGNTSGQSEWTDARFENRWFKSLPVELVAQSPAHTIQTENDAVIFNPFGKSVRIEINNREIDLEDWKAIPPATPIKLTNVDGESVRLVIVEVL
jgi:hypothetical protein